MLLFVLHPRGCGQVDDLFAEMGNAGFDDKISADSLLISGKIAAELLSLLAH